MQISIDLDLPTIISQAVSAERIQPILNKAIDEAVRSAIGNATGYNSEFGKALDEQLKAAMPHGLRLDDVAKFQHMLNGAMQKLVQDANNDAVNTAIVSAVKAAMPDVPAVVKMSDLVATAREGFHKEQHEEFYAYFAPGEYGNRLYLDSDPKPGATSHYSLRGREDRKHNASICIAFTKEGEVYSLKFQGKQITPTSRPDIISRFDATLMAMYVGRTRIDVDVNDDDVRSAASEQFD